MRKRTSLVARSLATLVFAGVMVAVPSVASAECDPATMDCAESEMPQDPAPAPAAKPPAPAPAPTTAKPAPAPTTAKPAPAPTRVRPAAPAPAPRTARPAAPAPEPTRARPAARAPEPTRARPAAPAPAPEPVKDCTTLSPEDAQKLLDSDPSKQQLLDPEKDGVACGLPPVPEPVRANACPVVPAAAAAPVPATAPALPAEKEEGCPLWLYLLAPVTGVGGFLLGRRNRNAVTGENDAAPADDEQEPATAP